MDIRAIADLTREVATYHEMTPKGLGRDMVLWWKTRDTGERWRKLEPRLSRILEDMLGIGWVHVRSGGKGKKRTSHHYLEYKDNPDVRAQVYWSTTSPRKNALYILITRVSDRFTVDTFL